MPATDCSERSKKHHLRLSKHISDFEFSLHGKEKLHKWYLSNIVNDHDTDIGYEQTAGQSALVG